MRRFHSLRSAIDEQLTVLRKLIIENKKKFWSDIAMAMGKTGVGCEKAAKNAKIQIIMY